MRGIYLDYNATTPIVPEVREAMLPFLNEQFGNPSSTHGLGRAGRQALEAARQQVATLLGAAPDEVLFTSGGTESNNLAIKGILLREPPSAGGHVVISAIEHPAVSEPARWLQRQGYAVSVVGRTRQGVVEPAAVEAALRPTTRLVSLMHANNETGVVQPLRQIAASCRDRGILLHTDAAQSVGKIRTEIADLGVDLLTLAGHKVYAPKGVGALYVRRGIRLEPALHGGGQERGLRPGTENVPYVVGLGKAAELVRDRLDVLCARLRSLRDRLQDNLTKSHGSELLVHGNGAERLPNTLSIAFPRVGGGAVLAHIPDLYASTGSACHSDAPEHISPVLAAMGLTASQARGTIRLSVGWYTTPEEVDRAAELLLDAWKSCDRAAGGE